MEVYYTVIRQFGDRDMPRVGEEPKGDSPMLSFRVPQELEPFLSLLARERGMKLSQMARQAMLSIDPPRAVSEFATKKGWAFKRATFLAQPKLQKSALFHDCMPDGRLNKKGEPLHKPELVSMNVLEVPGGLYLAAYCKNCERIYWLISTETPAELHHFAASKGWDPVRFMQLPETYFPPYSKGRPEIMPAPIKNTDGSTSRNTKHEYLPCEKVTSDDGQTFIASFDPGDRWVLWTRTRGEESNS
jgi:hypothetical protein